MNQKPVLRVLAWLGGSVSILVAGLAFAQVGRPGGGPVEVAAQDLSYDPTNGVTILTGNASVTQDGSVLRAPRIRVTYLRGSSGTSGNVDKVYTEGETFYVTPTERIRGDRAVFDSPANTVQFTGNVTAIQGQNVLRGSLLTLNTKTRASTMRGIDGRVRAVFFPDSQTSTSKTPAAKK
jgi:lipopolysaccharide export system protein LptA